MSDKIRVAVGGALGRMGSETVNAVNAEPDMEVILRIDPKLGRGIGGLDGDEFLNVGQFTDEPHMQESYFRREYKRPAVYVSFTTADVARESLPFFLDRGVHCLVGTTGIKGDQYREMLKRAPEGTILYVVPNFAIGAVLMMQLAGQVAKYMPNAEIYEMEHDLKFDSPSVTALRTAEIIAAARSKGFENNALLAYDPCDSEIDGSPERGLLHGEPRPVPIHSSRLPGIVARHEVTFGGQGQTLTIRHDAVDRTSFMPGVVMAIRAISDGKLAPGLNVGLDLILD